MTQLTLTSKSGSKGAIFAIDSAVAITIAIIVIAASAYFTTYSGGDPAATISTYRTGYDLITMMDYEGLFDKFDSVKINNFTDANLPASLNMRVEVIAYNSTLSNVTIGPSLADADGTLIVGERITTSNNHVTKARFYIWQK